MHFWTGVSTIAGALRRQVWFDQGHFTWFPNFYIILVAPPGVVSKSTTAGIGMSLLRKVPDIQFGPDVITWQALVKNFAESTITFQYQGEYVPMSALTLESSEFGNLLNPRDTEMIDLLVSLYDAKTGVFSKHTKMSGNDSVENPFLNIIACTTPAWVSGNFPQYLIGGGFTSRCVFVYAEKKAKLIAYPKKHIQFNFQEMARKLHADLCGISKLIGEFQMTKAAEEWGEIWYASHDSDAHIHMDPDRFGGYLSRKQGHVHKLAMILSVAESDELVLTDDHMILADQMVTDLETDMQFVFSKIGRSEDSQNIERLIWYIHTRGGCPFRDAYRYVHQHFPKFQDFESVVTGAIRTGFLKLEVKTRDGKAESWLYPGPVRFDQKSD